MSYSLRTGETVSLNALAARQSDRVSATETVAVRIMRDSVKRVARNDLNALAYVIRHSNNN